MKASVSQHPLLYQLGWDVKLQSQQVLEWQAQARAEVGAEGRRWLVLRILEVRFLQIPEDLAAALQHLTDREVLFRWLEAAVKAHSLDAFRAEVQPPALKGAK